MVRSELVKQIKAHKGDIWVAVSSFDDVMYVKAVKSDLIAQIVRCNPLDAETGFILEDGCFDKDYGSQCR